ncbi:MAG: hypothetical protein NTY09_08440 [bacterium]|nr:hypothetical protein [bacterium]
MEFAHPVMYWETRDGKTALYRISKTTNDIACIEYDLDGIQDIKTTGTSTYMLRENDRGLLGLTRRESDRELVTEANFETSLTVTEAPQWDASRNDVIAVLGKTETGENAILKLEFTRKEPEEAFGTEEKREPEITCVESVWYSTPDKIVDLTISDDGTLLAISILQDESTGDKGLYFIDSAGVRSDRISENSVIDLGGFSPDGSKYAATFDMNYGTELFLIAMDTLEPEMITRMAIGNSAGNPAWHPNGRYILYTVDYAEEFIEGAAPLSGMQLFLYSLDSDMSRRLAVFDNMKLWVDFSPLGDFFLYSSTPGAMARTGRAVEVTGENSGLETWRISYVPWDPEVFTTANFNMLQPEQTQHMVNYTVGGDTKIGFVWGPGGELPVENR